MLHGREQFILILDRTQYSHCNLCELTQITVRVLGSVKNQDELFSTMKHIGETIQIISTDNRQLLLPGIQQEDIEGMVL